MILQDSPHKSQVAQEIIPHYRGRLALNLQGALLNEKSIRLPSTKAKPWQRRSFGTHDVFHARELAETHFHHLAKGV